MQTRSGLWQQTPPAIFAPILGLFGMGLAWRRAPEIFPVSSEPGELMLGAISLLFLLAAFSYLAKFAKRPGVLLDDLKILPGRAGLSAATTSAMLLAAALIPYAFCISTGILAAAIVAHAVVAVSVLIVLAPSPLPQRRITPVWHLTFVGFTVAPLAAVPLGWTQLSQNILVLTVPMAITIWAGSAYLIAQNPVPAPLRPTLAIHLAPACLFGIVFALLGFSGLAVFFGWLSIAIAIVLIARVRYLTAAGFSPLWGAFTFPLAAFANLMLLLALQGGDFFRLLAGVALTAVTIVNSIIAYRVIKMWFGGNLAAKTNAARA